MDISDTLAPKSDQLDAVELVGGPRTFTVARVTAGNTEQPVNVWLEEFPRPWRPSKSMRRVLAAVWTPQAAEWTGRRLTLFCDPTVKFGGIEVGGVRVSHVSHIDTVHKIPLLVAKGKSAVFTVRPLTDQPTKTAVGGVNPADSSGMDGNDSQDNGASPAPDLADTSATNSATPITAAQSKMLHALFRDNNITDRALALAFCADSCGREVDSTKDLTKTEASRVIDALNAMAELSNAPATSGDTP